MILQAGRKERFLFHLNWAPSSKTNGHEDQVEFEASFSFLLKKKQSTWKHGSVWLPFCSPWGMKNVWSTPKWRVLTSLVRKPSCRRRLDHRRFFGPTKGVLGRFKVTMKRFQPGVVALGLKSPSFLGGGKLEIPLPPTLKKTGIFKMEATGRMIRI